MDNYEQWYRIMTNISSDIEVWLSNATLPDNAAIVFDIDSTLIDDYGNIIEPIYKIYNLAVDKGVDVVLITNREANPGAIDFTKNQLKKLGMTRHTFLYMRHPFKNDPYSYKKNARKNVWERGLNVVMSIGDMPWDVGEYGGHSVILPTYNPRALN